MTYATKHARLLHTKLRVCAAMRKQIAGVIRKHFPVVPTIEV